MKKIVLALIIALSFSSAVYAETLTEQQLVKLKQLVTFTEPPSPVSSNGVSIVIDAQQVIASFNTEHYSDDVVYTSSSAYLGVIGMNIKFTNENDTVAVISWKDSNVSVDGNNYGVPFLTGMKYKDAGNPSATPNTIIPPKGSTVVAALLPSVEFRRMWMYKAAPLLRDKFISFTYYINLNVNGKQEYATLKSPEIYIHKSYYEQVVTSSRKK